MHYTPCGALRACPIADTVVDGARGGHLETISLDVSTRDMHDDRDETRQTSLVALETGVAHVRLVGRLGSGHGRSCGIEGDCPVGNGQQSVGNARFKCNILSYSLADSWQGASHRNRHDCLPDPSISAAWAGRQAGVEEGLDGTQGFRMNTGGSRRLTRAIPCVGKARGLIAWYGVLCWCGWRLILPGRRPM